MGGAHSCGLPYEPPYSEYGADGKTQMSYLITILQDVSRPCLSTRQHPEAGAYAPGRYHRRCQDNRVEYRCGLRRASARKADPVSNPYFPKEVTTLRSLSSDNPQLYLCQQSCHRCGLVRSYCVILQFDEWSCRQLLSATHEDSTVFF
jgi:hypothetical protein